jgi:nucleoside-diphosphate-sugar epimerase
VKSADVSDLLKTNVESTRNILDACYAQRTGRVVYLSSVSVISGNDKEVLTEDLPYNASSAYGRSKIEAEKIALYYREKGLKIAILRPCMVFGPGEPHELNRILGLTFKYPVLYPGLTDLHDKLQLGHIDNIVDALELAMVRNEALSGTFMVADREIITIKKFLEIALEVFQKRMPIIVPEEIMKAVLFIPWVKEKFDRMFKDRIYDITRAVRLLEYTPRISTEKGLTDTVKDWLIRRRAG